MPTRMAADNKPRIASGKVSSNETLTPAWSGAQRGTIPTASLLKAAMHASSKAFWRPPAHDLPRGSPPHRQRRAQPFRIVEQTTGREIEWANRFLDLQCLR